MKTYKFVVVGAGPVGSHVALSILKAGLTTPESIALVDPLPPLELWKRRARNCGMTYLRSSSVHHIGATSSELERFQRRQYQHPSPWRGKARTPRVEIFNAHCEALLKNANLMESWLPVRLLDIGREPEHYVLQTCGGVLRTYAVVLAVGPHWKPILPDWLQPVAEHTLHLLDPNFQRDEVRAGERIAVLGGGMSSVQAALSFCDQHKVSLLTRSPIKISEFDAESSWMGPMKRDFLRASADDRVKKLAKVRRPGTVNKEVRHLLTAAERSGRLQCLTLTEPCSRMESGEVVLELEEATVRVDRVLLGIGFRAGSHPLVERIGQSLGAQSLSTGHPDLDTSLQWLPKLYVVGAPAELEIGPTARNILGGRLAVKRMLCGVGNK